MDEFFSDGVDKNGNKVSRKPQLDPTSRAFQSKKFIQQALRDISHGKFEGQLVNEVGREEEKTGEDLKQLIRDNLGVFIESKDAMNAIFEQDQTLFTGEALEPITDAFAEAEEHCRGLVDPTLASFMDVQQSRKSQAILEKLYSVLSVPGLLYEYCGVHVAQTKSAASHMSRRAPKPKNEAATIVKKKAPAAKKTGASSPLAAPETEDDEEDDEELEEDEEDEATSSSDDSVQPSPQLALGSLEGKAHGGPHAGGAYALRANEEVFYWCGTPLVRLKDVDAQRHHQEEVANYESAVLFLRRAMLYMEENYDLEEGTLLSADDFMDAAKESTDGGAPLHASSAGRSDKKKKVSAVSRSPFMYKFSLALLRAALYLVEQLAVELVYANAADTVLIEDTLSMMMDVSIATVKLTKFCRMLQSAIAQTNDLTGLRNKLVESAEEAESGAEAGLQSELTRSFEPSVAATPGAEGGGGGAAAAGPAHHQRHPAEYFVTITRSQHTRLTLASAMSLLREASTWKAKVQPPPTHAASAAGTAAASGQDGQNYKDVISYGGKGGDAFSISLDLGGNPNVSTTDSFTGLNGSSSSGKQDLENSMSLIGQQLRVGGFNVPQEDNVTATVISRDEAHIAEVQAKATSILEAFSTPEMKFPTYTAFTVGSVDMGDILDSSCSQVVLQAKAMLQQLSDRADTENTVMAQGALLNTFAARLSEACMVNLEHVMVSYWGGIATTIHAGVFDFNPDPSTSLGRMIKEVLSAAPPPASTATSAAAATSGARRPSSGNNFAMQDDSAAHDMLYGASGAKSPTDGNNDRNTFDLEETERLPELRFIPVLQGGAQKNASAASLMNSPLGESPLLDGQQVSLRDLSVKAVRSMVRSASAIMYSLFIAFANRSVVSAFVRRMAEYTVGDLSLHGKDELIELHAAILVEVIIGQWERIMTQVCESVLRMKVAIGESCSTSTITTDAQMGEIGELLSDLEQLRSSCFRCYIHGIGMLSKAYLNLFPMMQPGGGSLLEHRVRARLSRDFVSSPSTSKLLNLFSLVIDRTVSFLQRHVEVYYSADLFAAKEEDLEVPDVAPGGAADGGGNQPRRRVLRRRRDPHHAQQTSASRAPSVRSDPITQYVANAHAQMVLEQLEEQEEMLEVLVSNLLLSFIDMLHVKCQSVTGNHDIELGDRERDIMECMADALCLPTTVAPILQEHLLLPCLFTVTSRLRTADPAEVAMLVGAKCVAFEQQYLPRVGEHCQLAVDAMVNMYLAIPQQQITREVRQGGFMVPLFDWQRVTAHTCAAVRPYIAQCLITVAQAHETLHWIHQPALGSAVTQRLIAHLASTFVTAISVDINAFEVSLECSHDFLLYGLLLIEAEAQTVLAVLQAVMDGVTRNSKAGAVLPELLLARDSLQGIVLALLQQDTIACETIGAARAAEAAVGAGKQQQHGAAPLNRTERSARRDAMVSTAMEHLRYMVDAINTHLEEAPTAQHVNSEVTRKIAERLAKRKEGYETKVAKRAEKAKEKTRVKVQRSSTKSATSPQRNADAAASAATPVPAPAAAEPEQEKQAEADTTMAAALYQNAVGIEKQGRQRTLRRRRDNAAAAAATPEPASAAAPHKPLAQETTPDQQVHVVASPAAEPSSQEAAGDAAPRRTRRRVVTISTPTAADEPNAHPRERRANRFKRSNAV